MNAFGEPARSGSVGVAADGASQETALPGLRVCGYVTLPGAPVSSLCEPPGGRTRT